MKPKEVKEIKETLYTRKQVINSKKYRKYKDLLMSILQNNKSYSSSEIDIKIREFLERKV